MNILNKIVKSYSTITNMAPLRHWINKWSNFTIMVPFFHGTMVGRTLWYAYECQKWKRDRVGTWSL